MPGSTGSVNASVQRAGKGPQQASDRLMLWVYGGCGGLPATTCAVSDQITPFSPALWFIKSIRAFLDRCRLTGPAASSSSAEPAARCDRFWWTTPTDEEERSAHNHASFEESAVFVSSLQTEILLSLHDFGSRLESPDRRCAQIVKMIYFTGLTQESTAWTFGNLGQTVRREWRLMRACLRGEVRKRVSA